MPLCNILIFLFYSRFTARLDHFARQGKALSVGNYSYRLSAMSFVRPLSHNAPDSFII